MSQSDLILVFLGAPGAGKGTQAAVVGREMDLARISSGDLFRKAVERGDELGLKVKKYIENGALVPDAITISMVLEQMLQYKPKRVILDGFPRNLSQARSLDRALEASGDGVDGAVYIDVPQAKLLQRLSSRWVCRICQAPHQLSTTENKEYRKCGQCGGDLYQRPDDTRETILNRLKVYFEETTPLIDYYRGKGKLINIDGGDGIEQVSQRILDTLCSRFPYEHSN